MTGRVEDTRPVWLLDVDGVINVNRPRWGETPRRGEIYVAEDGYSYQFRWAHSLVRQITAIHEAGTVEIRWCTTWCHLASDVEKLLGLPVLTRALTHIPQDRNVRQAKIDAAQSVLHAGRALIWTDDQEVPRHGMLRDELTREGRSLLIRPSETTGLTPDDIARIRYFITQVTLS